MHEGLAHTDQEPPKKLSLTELQQLNRTTLLSYLLENRTEPLALDEAKALVCIMVRDHAQSHLRYDEEDINVTTLPWPETEISTDFPHSSFDDTQRAQLLLEAAVITPQQAKNVEIIEDEWFDSLFFAIRERLKTVDPETKTALSVYLISHLELWSTFAAEPFLLQNLIDLALGDIDVFKEKSLQVGEAMLDFIRRNFTTGEPFQTVPDDRKILSILPDGIKAQPTIEYDDLIDIYWWLLSQNRPILLHRALATSTLEQTEKNFLLGLLLRENWAGGYADQLNFIRQALEHGPTSEKAALEELARQVLYLVPNLNVHTSLENLYKTIKFEEYPLTHQVETQRVEEMTHLLQRLQVNPEDRILELGSGTGWLTGGLLRNGFEEAHGLDIVERHVELSREKHGDHFTQGSWYEIPDQLEHQQVIISKERDLPHVENEYNFRRVLTEVHAHLENGGYFIFDMPDPTVGSYRETISRYRTAMKELGFTDRDLKNFWFIVDSPDGLNFYNRYVPSREEIQRNLEVYGFELIEEIREPMPNDNQNMLFICRKKTPLPQISDPGSHRKSQNRIRRELLRETGIARISPFKQLSSKLAQTMIGRFWRPLDDQ